MNDAQTFAPAPVTPMLNEHVRMLTLWHVANPKIKTAELAANLQRLFSMQPGTAWVLACRFRNEQHTKANQ